MKKFLGLAAALLVIAGCNEAGVRALDEQAEREAQKQVEADNASQEKKAAEMEADLTSRQHFYQGLRGTYEGTFRAAGEEMRIRITLIPTVSPYATARVRRLEEIAADLVGLSFSAQVVQWTPAVPLSAVGCRVEGIRPDLVRGEINIASVECSNVYLLRLSMGESSMPEERRAGAQISESLARSLIGGGIPTAPGLEGEIRPSQNSDTYSFAAGRQQ